MSTKTTPKITFHCISINKFPKKVHKIYGIFVGGLPLDFRIDGGYAPNKKFYGGAKFQNI